MLVKTMDKMDRPVLIDFGTNKEKRKQKERM